MNNHINTKEIKQLLFSHAFFLFSRHLLHAFMSIFIWNLTSDLSKVALFNIIFLFTHLVVFSLAAPFVKKGYTHLVKSVGLIGLVGFFSTLAFLGDKAANYIIPLAFFMGSMNSLYWLHYHVANFNLTHTQNRGNFTGTERSLKIFVNLLAPIIGGWLIVAPFGFGYGNMFVVGAISIIFCLFFGFVKIEKKQTHAYHFKKTLKHVIKDGDFLRSLFSCAVANFSYQGALRELIPIFIFIVLKNEFHVGGWISFFAALSILVTLSIGRRLSYAHYKKITAWTALLFSASVFSLITKPILLTYIIFGAAKEMFEPILTIPRRVYYANLLHRLEDHRNHRVEYLVIREWFSLIGRILSFVPLLFISNTSSTALLILISIMAFTTLLEPILVRYIKTDITTL